MKIFKENGGITDDAIAVAKQIGCPINYGDLNNPSIMHIEAFQGGVDSSTFWSLLSAAILTTTVEQLQVKILASLDEIVQELKRLRHTNEILADNEAPESVEE